jgi:hypothetical protein
MNQLRMNVRNFLLVATEAEVRGELALSIERGDTERAGYVEECLCELLAESAESAESAECKGCPGDSGLGVPVDFAGCPGFEDCIGCPESGDCADETY